MIWQACENHNKLLTVEQQLISGSAEGAKDKKRSDTVASSTGIYSNPSPPWSQNENSGEPYSDQFSWTQGIATMWPKI